MNNQEFHIVAEAILLYFRERQSLFADQVVAETLKLSPSLVREKLRDNFGCATERLVKYLEPERIRMCIERTRVMMQNQKDDCNNIIVEPLENSGAKNICYRFADTPYGSVIIASTGSGVCYVSFTDNGKAAAIDSLRERFKNISLRESSDTYQQAALDFFYDRELRKKTIKLQLMGTDFQLSVWRKLLQIPPGGLMSYSALAGNRKDSHAFGNGVGRNPVAFIVPCHRVVPASGEFGEYHWGKARKAAMICMEAAAVENGKKFMKFPKSYGAS